MSTALLVVDVQVDFCESGALAVPGGDDVARRVRTFLDEAGGEYDHVLATRDTHVDPGRHFSGSPDLVTSWPPHCVAGTDGARLHEALLDVRFDETFDKGRFDDGYSGFDGTDGRGRPLSAYLRAHDVEAVDCVGLATDYCVGRTAHDAVRLGFRTRVFSDLSAGISADAVQEWTERLRRAGAEVLGSDGR